MTRPTKIPKMYYAYGEDCLTFVHFCEPHCIEDVNSSKSLRNLIRHFTTLSIASNEAELALLYLPFGTKVQLPV